MPFLLFANSSFAETKTFIKEYTFQAGDEDSKNSSRVIALREVKRLLLEELGTYLESTTEVQNFKLTKDQIVTLTAGIVQTELVEEKWDGKTYWLNAKIIADSINVIKSIDTLRQDRQKTKELEETRKRSEELLKENARLRQELATADGEKKQKDTVAYSEIINLLRAVEWFEKGFSLFISANYKDAIVAFSNAIENNLKYAKAYSMRGVSYSILGEKQSIKDCSMAIELAPQDPDTYFGRGCAYIYFLDFQKAINDFNRVIELAPRYSMAYSFRGVAYSFLGNQQQSISDCNMAIELDPRSATLYSNRGSVYGSLGNYKQAVIDLTKAIEIDPKLAIALGLRGSSYLNLGKYNQAINDFNKAIALDKNASESYFGRGIVHNKLGHYQQGKIDMIMAARLGSKNAQEYLKGQGISW